MSRLTRLVRLARSRTVDRDLNDEQQFHVDARIEELVARGLSRDAARAEALRRFGGRLQTREASRDIRVIPWLDSLLRDLRIGLRMLRRDAAVSGAAIVSLGLALGACAAAFSLVDALVLRPLPVADPQRLVYLSYATGIPERPYGESFSYPIFTHLRDAVRNELDLVLVSGRNQRETVIPDGDGQREQLRVQFLSGHAFDVLGVKAAHGRLLRAADDLSPGASPVAVMSHAFWQRRFGGDPAAIGRQLRLGDQTIELVGVTEPAFFGIEPGVQFDLWLPATMYDARAFTGNEWQWLRIIGRLRPGVDTTRAQAIVQAAFTDVRRDIARSFQSRPPAEVEGYVRTRVEVQSAARGPSPLRRQFERPLAVLALVAALVLLIAASNVANLLLARAATREREMSLRLSIGAGRGRLIQQLAVESALLGSMAATLGLAVAAVAAPAVLRMIAPADEPVLLDLRIDGRLIAFLLGLTTLTTLLFGVAPARRASRAAPAGSGDTRSRVTSRARLLEPLIAVEVAVSVTVLFVAGLLLVSFDRLLRVDLGFDKANVLLANVRASGPPDRSPADIQAQLLERVRALPGVESASLSAWPMFTDGGWVTGVRIPGRPPNDADRIVHLPISPGFVTTMRMRLVEGRELTRTDRETPAGAPVIVNEAFARRYFGRARVTGERYQRAGNRQIVPQEIVGVVADARYNDLREAAPPTVFTPLTGVGSLQVRTSGDPMALGAAVRRAVQATHPALWVSSLSLQSTLVDNSLLRERLLATLSAFFGGVGLLLAAVGLYGVLSYAVVQRTREIGVRLALGAPRASVVVAVVTRVAVMTAIGVAAGLGSGLFLARFVRAWLFEVQPYEASSLALPVAALLAMAAPAALVPSLRATRVDPIVALREE